MKSSKKRIISVFAILVMAIVLSCIFAACDKVGEKQVPVYKGMTISRSFATSSAATAAEDNGNHYGHFKGDHNDRDDEVDQNKPFEDPNAPSIEDKANSTLDVVGSAESIYYADKNQDIFITIRLSNPDSYEILSFTLNGKKYSNYMFEDGSDMENLVLKVNVGDVGGIVEYTIDAIKYVDGTEIKDVRMDGDRTVKAGVRASDQTYVNVTNEQKTMTSISFDAQVVDLYSLIEKSGGYAKAVLYDGVNMLTKDVKIGEKTSVVFDNLTPNTVYQYGVVALYDNLSGNGAKLNTIYKKAVYTDTIVLFKDVQVGKESIEWGFLWNESFANKQMSAISLWQNGAKVQDVDTTATRLDGLKSNNKYTLKATYNNLQNQDETIAIEFITYAKAVPAVEIANVQSTQTAISFELNVTDTDNVGAITKIELLHGNDEPIVAENTARSFENLLSDNDYTIQVTYVYDLNDGVGERQIVKTTSITTKAKAVPTVEITNVQSTQTAISFELNITDTDNVGAISKIELLHGDDEPIVASDLTDCSFANLKSGNIYTIYVEFVYDLNDNKGSITDKVEKEIATDIGEIKLSDAQFTSDECVLIGNKVDFKVAFWFDSIATLEGMSVNGQYFQDVTNRYSCNGSINANQIGNVPLVVDRIAYRIGDTLKSRTVNIDTNLTYQALDTLNGVKITPLTSSNYGYIGEGLLLTFDNSYGYRINLINDNNDFVMFGNNKVFAKCNSITSISYGYNQDKSITQTFDYKTTLVGDVKQVKHIRTVDDFINISKENVATYYILDNDINIGESVTLDKTITQCIIDGRGHSINGLNYIATNTSSTVIPGIFGRKVTIYDTKFNNINVVVTSTKQSKIHPFGSAQMINCEVTGVFNGFGDITFTSDFTINNATSNFDIDVNISDTFANKISSNNTEEFKGTEKNIISKGGLYLYEYEENKQLLISFADYVDGMDIVGGTLYVDHLTIPKEVTVIAPYAFAMNITEIDGCLRHVKINGEIEFEEGSQLTIVGKRAFYLQLGVTKVHFPASVTVFSQESLYSLSPSGDVVIEGRVEEVGGNAFDSCNIKSIKYGKLTHLDQSMIPSSAIEIELPSTLKVIEERTFFSVNIKRIFIPKSVMVIEDEAFHCSDGLEEVVIEEGSRLTTIGSYAFSKMGPGKSLKINLPDTVTSIADNAFHNAGLKDLYIGAKMQSINWIKELEYIQSITVSEENTKYRSVGNCLIDKKTKALIKGCTSSVIPDDGSVVSISKSAFVDKSVPAKLNIPKSILIIEYGAFGTENLYSITLNKVPYMDEMASGFLFGSCPNLYEVYNLTGTEIEAGSTTCGKIALYAKVVHTSLDEPSIIEIDEDSGVIILDYDGKKTAIGVISPNPNLVIPEGVEEIAENAFYYCSEIVSITFPSTLKKMSYSSFMYCTNVERIEIPSIEQWVKVEVVEFAGQTPTYVFFKEGNFYVNGELIVDCVIPEGVTEINTSVFGYCESIKTITFSDTVETIDGFDSCWNLESITLSANVKKINDYAFSCSNNLKTINFKGTMDEWYAIEKDGQWITSGGYKVYCTDGTISVGNVE